MADYESKAINGLCFSLQNLSLYIFLFLSTSKHVVVLLFRLGEVAGLEKLLEKFDNERRRDYLFDFNNIKKFLD